MFCSNCGSDVGEAQFCPQCGAKVGGDVAQPASAPEPSAVQAGIPTQGQYAPMPGQYAQPYPVPVRTMVTNRGLLKFVLLGLITFGIYPLVVMSEISGSINEIASRYDGRKTMHYCLLFFIVGPITLGIGYLVWTHRICDRMGNELRRRGIDYNIGAGTFWLWGVLGCVIIVGPFVYKYKFLKAMNMLSADYNLRG